MGAAAASKLLEVAAARSEGEEGKESTQASER